MNYHNFLLGESSLQVWITLRARFFTLLFLSCDLGYLWLFTVGFIENLNMSLNDCIWINTWAKTGQCLWKGCIFHHFGLFGKMPNFDGDLQCPK